MVKYISLTEIYSKIKTKEDIQNYYKEQGKINYNLKNIGLYYPRLFRYNNKFF